MKFTKIMAIAMAAIVGFTACSKDDSNDGKDGNESSLIVYLPNGTVPASRAVDAPSTPTTETTLDNAVIYLLNNSSVVDIEEVTPADILSGYKQFEQVRSSVNGVAVVANIPASSLNDLKDASTILTVNDFEKFAFSVASQATTGILGKVLMGKTYTLTTDTNPAGEGHDYKRAEVALDAITARFEIDGITAGEGVQNVKLEGIWINNFLDGNAATTPTHYGSTHASWDTTPATNSAGSASALTPVSIDNAYSPSAYHDVYDPTVDGTSFVYSYQLFAGSYVPHVVMLVSGQYTNGEYFLAYLTFNYFTDSTNARITEVENNVIYKVSGAVCHARDLTTEPELSGYDLGLQCTITPWTDKNVTPGIE